MMGKMIIKTTGDQTNEVRYTGESIDPPSALDWEEIGNYGTDIEVEEYLLNHDGTCDYGDIGEPTEIEAYKVFGEDNARMRYRGKEQRTFKQPMGECKGGRKLVFGK